MESTFFNACMGMGDIREWQMGWEQVMMQNFTECHMGLESEELGFMPSFVNVAV